MRPLMLLLALALPACASIPADSLRALQATDPATTELAALRAAVEMPDALRPRPGTARLAFRLGGREGRFGLEEDEAASRRAQQDAAPPAGRRITVFRLTAEGRDEMEAFRRLPAGRRMTIGIAADACRDGPLDDGPLMIGTWVSTAETGRLVALTRFDLRRVAGDAAIAALPACAAPAEGPA